MNERFPRSVGHVFAGEKEMGRGSYVPVRGTQKHCAVNRLHTRVLAVIGDRNHRAHLGGQSSRLDAAVKKIVCMTNDAVSLNQLPDTLLHGAN